MYLHFNLDADKEKAYVETTMIDNIIAFEVSMFFFITTQKQIHVVNTIKTINSTEKISIKDDNRRGYRHFVTPIGIMQILEKSHIFSIYQKKKISSFLKAEGLIGGDIIFQTSQEKIFGESLRLFINGLCGEQIIYQFGIEKYSVDFAFHYNNKFYFVEFDENNHIGYDKNKEKERENRVKQECDLLIRVSNFHSNEENLGKIAKAIHENRSNNEAVNIG